MSKNLVKYLEGTIRQALEGRGVDLHTGKCVVCMEGPQFSTRAESNMYRLWGGDLINMSVLPEAKLAREAELRYFFSVRFKCILYLTHPTYSYALIATSTDYDSWRNSEVPVTTEEIFKTLTTNAETSRHVTATVLGGLHGALERGDILFEEEGGMKFSIMPRHDSHNQDDMKKLSYILPQYFP